ncbi:MAG: sodium:proton antiporter [Alphaproteobacteria bacterium]|nr:sodium:proton antiporter [Alphaproteobacteria bacterium]
MTVFQTTAILLTFAALGSFINTRFLRLPASIGMMLFALLLSWGGMGLARLGWLDLGPASNFIADIDFSHVFLHGMLSFLLFAGALQVDFAELKKYKVVVAVLATIGVLIATAVTGSLVWLAAAAMGLALPYTFALLFGALIAPTDPIAVLSILKGAPLGKGLRVKIACESLLNDGVGVVVFLALLGLAAATQDAHMSWSVIGLLFLWAGAGGVILGLALGWLALMLLRRVDDYKTEILITLALAAGGYALAEAVYVSAPITMVVAGLVIGNHGRLFSMTDKTRKHMDMFWELFDDILNAVLFLLIGLEIMVMPFSPAYLTVGAAAVAAVLAGRFVSVAVPIGAMQFVPGRWRTRFERHTVPLMTWGGLRGGISVALALSLPPSPYKNTILEMTYLTVVFSVLFQGTTFALLIDRLGKQAK